MMQSNIALRKEEIQLFTLDEQIEIINFEINKLEKIKRRTDSSERINQRYTLSNQFKTMRTNLINNKIYYSVRIKQINNYKNTLLLSFI